MTQDIITPAASVQMLIQHSMVHRGQMYSLSDYEADVDIASPKYWYIEVGAAVVPHMVIWVAADDAGVVELKEGSAITANGEVALTPVNMNRNSSGAALTAFYDSVTVDTEGTAIYRAQIKRNGSEVLIGGEDHEDTEIVLKASTNYFVKYTTEYDNTRAWLNVTFYEPSRFIP